MSILQKPQYDQRNYAQSLKLYINDYNTHLKDHFKENISGKKFKKIMNRETSKTSFKTGLAKRILWDEHIAYKYEHNLYHHLDTIKQWEMAKDPRSGSSQANKIYERKVLNKGVNDLYLDIK